MAIQSNCGKFLKICIPSQRETELMAENRKLGYGKKYKHDMTIKSLKWIIRSQVLSAVLMRHMDAVQRLNVCAHEKN
jgi:hypothetical protein